MRQRKSLLSDSSLRVNDCVPERGVSGQEKGRLGNKLVKDSKEDHTAGKEILL